MAIYKLEEGTKSFERVNALVEKFIMAETEAKVLVDDLGGENYVGNPYYFCGGIAAIKFDKKPKGFKKHQLDGFYQPSKTNKTLVGAFAKLPVVTYEEVRTATEFKTQVLEGKRIIAPGIKYISDAYFITVDDRLDYDPNPEFIEITKSEFNKIWEQQ